MVIFITSRSAYEEMKELVLSGNHAIWLASNILDDAEIDSIWEKDVELSVFNYEVDTSEQEDLECAMSTIKEHHPDQNIWVQYLNEN